MSMFRVNLLGTPEIRWAGEIRPLRLRKAMALLTYLAVTARPHPREELAALLWPEASEHDGRAALRSTLSCLRLGLEAQDQDQAGAALRSVAGMVELMPGALALDVQDLTTAAAQAGEHVDLPGLRATLEGAVQSYRGDFLTGLSLPDAPDFEAWILAQREVYHQRLGRVLARLVTLYEAAGDLPSMLATLEQWLAHDPLEEDACRQLLTACLSTGESTRGIRAYEAYRAVLATDLDAEPSLEMQALAEQLQAARRGALSCSIHTTPFTGPVLDLPLVGRAAHLVGLRDHLARVQRGQLQVVILEGEAGSGKTRLAREFLSGAHEQTTDILDGRAFEAGSQMPYAVLVEALRPRLERENAPDDLLSDLWLGELARLLPELRERYPDLPPTTDHGESSTHVCEAVVRLLHALAQRRPVVLFLDDAQWSDTATRELLVYAARRWAASGTRLLLVLAVRCGDLGTTPSLANWLRQLAREAPVTRLELSPLDEAATERLVEALAGAAPADMHSEAADFAAWLYAETSGWPLAIADTLQMLLEDGALGLREELAGGWVLDIAAAGWQHRQRHGVLPPRVQETIAARLRRLEPLTLTVLAAAAVVGTRFTFEHLCQVAEIPERDTVDALDMAVRARLLCEDDVPGCYRFAYDKIRDVIYAQAGTARRQVVQRRLLAVATETHGPLATDTVHACLDTPPLPVPEPALQALQQRAERRTPPWNAPGRFGCHSDPVRHVRPLSYHHHRPTERPVPRHPHPEARHGLRPLQPVCNVVASGLYGDSVLWRHRRKARRRGGRQQMAWR